MKHPTMYQLPAALALLLLGACSSTDMNRNNTAPTASSDSAPTAEMAGSSVATPSGWTAPANANSVVTNVEIVPRQSASVGAGTVAGAAVGGTMGNSSDRVYRVNIRMDDGSTKTLTQETMPAFKSGDRIRVDNDIIQP